MDYSGVQAALDAAVRNNSIGAHGNFWRQLSRNDFINYTVFGEKLVIVGNGAGSNLILALKGVAPFDGSEYVRMPDGYPAVADATIAAIEKWIDEGCPE